MLVIPTRFFVVRDKLGFKKQPGLTVPQICLSACPASPRPTAASLSPDVPMPGTDGGTANTCLDTIKFRDTMRL